MKKFIMFLNIEEVSTIKELIDDITGTKDFVIIAISITRFQAIEAKKT